mgnify:CR=1 FL=1
MATYSEFEDGQSQPDGDPGGDAGLDEAVAELESAEASRKRFGLIVGLIAIVCIVGAVLLLIQFRDTLLVPKPSETDLEQAAQKNLDRTDDPQCRQLIADITDIQNRFFAMESRFESVIPDADQGETQTLLADLRTLKAELKEAESLSDQAALRFDRSEKELENWFDYVTNEILILEDVLVEQLARLREAAGSDVGVRADTGTEVTLDGIGTWEDEDMPPADRRDRSLVALHEAFDSFRVWHSGYEHPCGSNADDEEPWRPPAEAK